MTRGQRVAHARIAWLLLVAVLAIAAGAIALRESARASIEREAPSGAGSAEPSDGERGPVESHTMGRGGRAPSETAAPR